MFRSERLFHRCQLDIFSTYFSSSRTIVSRWLSVFRMHLTEFVITKFVRNTIQQRRCSIRSNIEVTSAGIKISFVRHVVGKHSRTNTNWPQKLVDVIRRISAIVRRLETSSAESQPEKTIRFSRPYFCTRSCMAAKRGPSPMTSKCHGKSWTRARAWTARSGFFWRTTIL